MFNSHQRGERCWFASVVSVLLFVAIAGVEAANVKDFGATGDGETDDTAAFVEAAESDRDIFVPAGVYLLKTFNLPEESRPHREMTGEEIESIISDFVSATLRAREAGFDAVQFHGAHGYLMNQVLSPLFNHRTDQWGGNADNRRRFHLDIIRKVRQAVGADFPLMTKLGVQDDLDGGLSFDEGLETAKQMVQEGIDAIEISRGIGAMPSIARQSNPEQAYFRERTAAVKRALTVPVMAVGGIRSLELASDLVDSGDADLISMCRPFIREPGLIARWQRGETEPATCISCGKCHEVIVKGKHLVCVEERRRSRKARSDT